MKRVTETDLARAVLQALERRRIWAWRVNSGDRKIGRSIIRGAPSGTPDILVVLAPEGRLGGLECKAPKGKQRPSQEQWEAKAKEHGVGYALVRSVGEALRAVEEWRKGGVG